MSIWLYHINPKRTGYKYSWQPDRPRSILRSRDKEWFAVQMFRSVNDGDTICVYMKNIPPQKNGVCVLGSVTKVNVAKRTFRWLVDAKRSARRLSDPIPEKVIRKFFGRSYGNSMQRLTAAKETRWLHLFQTDQVVDGVPLLKAKGKPHALSSSTDPFVSRENGLRGELHVLKILSERYPESRGYVVTHISKQNSDSDHDIVVRKGRKVVRLVEVKTRFGVRPDPVIMSERELACRTQNRAAHSIFIVYLSRGAQIREVVEIGSDNAFALKPRQHWLTPGIVLSTHI